MNYKKIIFNKSRKVSLDEFISKALYDKKNGYYMKKTPLGKKGDFITAPLISNLFSEMIAVWCVSFWENIGQPKKINFVELGPGDGSLCKTILKTFKKFPKFNDCCEIFLYEISDKLKKIQNKKLKNKKIKWLKNINNIKTGPTIFFGNEFFDSLPIKQFVVSKKKIFEKYVLLNEKNDLKYIYQKAKKKYINQILNFKIPVKRNIIEFPIETIKYLEIISRKITKYDGALLIFDYGYNSNCTGDSVQSVSKHRYTNIFSKIGNSDISSHVNFRLISNFLTKKNLVVEKIVNQNSFLYKMGIVDRANIISKNLNFRDKADLYYRLKRLLDEKNMGSLFKVLLAKKKYNRFSTGFN